MSQPRWEKERDTQCLYLGAGLVVCAVEEYGHAWACLYRQHQGPDACSSNLGLYWHGRDFDDVREKVEGFFYEVRRQLNCWDDR